MTALRRTVAIALGIVSMLVLSAPAVPGQQGALVVGESPPTSFELSNLDGEPRSLAAARGDHAVLLVFFRGTW